MRSTAGPAAAAPAAPLAPGWLDAVRWDADGLVPVIAQEQGSKDVLMRDEALERILSGHLEAIVARLGATIRDIEVDELRRASEIFLSNAVRGVVPVASLADRRYGVGPAAAAARAALAAEGFEPPRAA